MPCCGPRHVLVRAPIAASSVPELRRLATLNAAVVTDSRQERALTSSDHSSDEPVHNRIRRTSRRLRCVAICLFRLLEPGIGSGEASLKQDEACAQEICRKITFSGHEVRELPVRAVAAGP